MRTSSLIKVSDYIIKDTDYITKGLDYITKGLDYITKGLDYITKAFDYRLPPHVAAIVGARRRDYWRTSLRLLAHVAAITAVWYAGEAPAYPVRATPMKGAGETPAYPGRGADCVQ